MGVLKEVYDYVKANTTLVSGTNLQYAYTDVDAKERNVLTLLQSNNSPLNFYTKDTVDFMLQVIARSFSYPDADNNAEKVKTLIHGLAGINLNNTYIIKTSEGLSHPQFIGLDKEGRSQLSANYIIHIMHYAVSS